MKKFSADFLPFGLHSLVERMYDRGMATGTLERLEDRLADLCGHRNVLDALLVRLVAEALGDR